ncbi:hypothetical protein LCGC14_0439210 [marine sediment metagenome]|uniref:Uncharacterized protein n=1 Tax=marine sediment metagenome TaxID=412755 RepID=A0A0F9VV32_9ZZZZ
MDKELQKTYKKTIKNLIYLIFTLTLFVIGCTLNFIVVSGNHGKMPIYYESDVTYCNDYYITFDSWAEVRYEFLSDIIPIGERMASVGDTFIIGSLPFLFIFSIKLYKLLKQQRRLENVTYSNKTDTFK